MLPSLNLVSHLDSECKFTGTIRLEPIKHDVDKKRHARKTLTWHETQGEKAVNIPSIVKEPGMVWYRGKTIIAQSQDECKVGLWIFASSPFNMVSHSIGQFL